MFKRIIVAVDGSTTSTRALRAAIALAREHQAKLCIAHVVDLVALFVESPYDSSEYEAAVRKAGEQFLKRAVAIAHKAGIDAETRLLEVEQIPDRSANEIVRAARQWKADLIVIGTHGRRGVSRLFLGSVAESVLRIATTPVLLIRGK